MADRIVGTGFDRIPWWNPKRTHATCLVKDLRDVSAFHGNCYTQRIIFHVDGATVVEQSLSHNFIYGVTTWAPRASNPDPRDGAFRLHHRACERESSHNAPGRE